MKNNIKYVIEGQKQYRVVTYDCGCVYWYHKGIKHRENGPAEYSSGTNCYASLYWKEAWYQHGKRHREDGPAVIYQNGTKSFYLDGVELTQGRFLEKQKDQIVIRNDRIYLIDGRPIKGI